MINRTDWRLFACVPLTGGIACLLSGLAEAFKTEGPRSLDYPLGIGLGSVLTAVGLGILIWSFFKPNWIPVKYRSPKTPPELE